MKAEMHERHIGQLNILSGIKNDIIFSSSFYIDHSIVLPCENVSTWNNVTTKQAPCFLDKIINRDFKFVDMHVWIMIDLIKIALIYYFAMTVDIVVLMVLTC